MNMNMKNEKTMLALVLVAALAMVSVAGVALASESDAAIDPSTYTKAYGNLDITSESKDNYGVYVDSLKNSVVTIADDAAYSGNICFGSYIDNVYVSYVTLTLTDVSNAVITYNYDSTNNTYATEVTMYVYDTTDSDNKITGVVSGNIVISQGTITLGDTGKYFTGSVAGNTATITAVNVIGFELTAETTDIVGGVVSQGAMQQLKEDKSGYETAPAKINLAGKATFDVDGTTVAFVIGDNVTFTVAEDAVLSGGDNVEKYIVKTEKTIELDLAAYTTGGVKDYYGMILDENNNKISQAYLVNNGSLTQFVLPALTDLSKTYTLIISEVVVDSTTATGAQMYTYVGSLSFNVEETTTAGEYKVTPVFGSNTSITYLSSTDFTYVTAAKATYDSKKYTALFATSYSISNGALTENKITFSVAGELTGTGVFVANQVVVVGMVDVSGNYCLYFTKLGASGAFGSCQSSDALAIVNTTSTKISEIKASIKSDDEKNVAVMEQTSTITIASSGKMVIAGTLNLNYTSAKSCATITNDGTITVTGHIYYRNAAIPSIGGTVNAAYYTTTYTTAPKYLRTYTTIKAALSESADITILGTHDILEDFELVSTLSGATSTKIAVAGATINIGDDDEDTPISATVTKPTSTTLNITGNGKIDVKNGAFRVAGATKDVYGTNSVVAAVFYTTTEYGIYTDLATALDGATSGDVISLRQDANVSRKATVIAGVTLDAKNAYSITIKSGGELVIVGKAIFATVTVEGKSVASGSTPAKAAGILTINSNDVTFTTANIVGVVNMGASDLKLSSGVININSTDSKNPVIFNITGTVNSNGVQVNSTALNITTTGVYAYVTWNVSGTFTNKVTPVDGGNAGKIVTTMNVTGSYIANSDLYAENMTVTGNGSVTAADKTDFVVYVTGELVIGTETKDIAANTNNATVVVTLGDDATAYVYGNFDKDKIVLASETAGTTLDSAAFIIRGNTYCTIYGTPANNMPVSSPTYFLYAPVFTNYTLVAWYSDADLTTKVTTTPTGDDLKYYAEVEGKSFFIKITYIQNGSWIVNDRTTSSGSVELIFGDDNTISFTAADGYTWTGKILVNGNEMPTNYTPKADDVFTVSAEPVEKEKPAEGMDLVTILLIIITIVIIIMAIIIALKLMRS